MDLSWHKKLSEQLEELSYGGGENADLFRDAADSIRMLANWLDIVETDRRVERRLAYEAAVRRERGL